MSYSKACCTLPPISSDYTPVGTFEEVGDFKVYTVGPKDATKAVLVFYDIFGFHVNSKQFCDILAQNCGWKVVMPDFFRGKPLVESDLADIPKLLKWVELNGSEKVITPDVVRVQEHLKKQGVTAGTFVGFCWGAKLAVQLTSTLPFFVGASCIHPSFVDVKDAELAGAPILNIPSKDEPDMTEYMAVLAKKPFGDKCKMVRFDDQHHGFCASRGDFTNELNVKRVNEAIKLTVDFFSECFENSNTTSSL